MIEKLTKLIKSLMLFCCFQGNNSLRKFSLIILLFFHIFKIVHLYLYFILFQNYLVKPKK